MSKGQRLYRKVFQPVADIGEIIALTDAKGGFVSDDNETPFYMVSHVEGAPLLSQARGVIGIWSHTAALASPYKLDKGAQANINSGADIAAGASLGLDLDFVRMQKRQVMQWRAIPVAVPDSAAGALTGGIDDYDISIAAPTAVPRWGSTRLTGILNHFSQGFFPGVGQSAPAQDTGWTGSTSQNMDPMELAYRSELFSYGDSTQNARVTITNNGSVITAAGGIGLYVGAYIINMVAVPAEEIEEAFFCGYRVPVPRMVRELEHGIHDVIVVPTAGHPTPKGMGQ